MKKIGKGYRRRRSAFLKFDERQAAPEAPENPGGLVWIIVSGCIVIPEKLLPRKTLATNIWNYKPFCFLQQLYVTIFRT
ncbi:MAG: hypothetical protein LBP22_04200 [Deltaproteobacteria bacterium]|jgi:hypothetical protein|nr:hypothetical protein [Deltaproteobacteria bacterium]